MIGVGWYRASSIEYDLIIIIQAQPVLSTDGSNLSNCPNNTAEWTN